MRTQTKIPSGSLQVQKGRFHMVIHVEREGKMTPVWRTTGLPAEERFRAQAETMLQETRLRLAYDPAFREEFLARKRQKPQTSAPGGKKKSGAPAAKPLHPEQQTVADYLRGWYQSARPNLARATRTSYEQMLNCRILPHFEALGITMAELRPPHIQQLIDRIFAEGCNGTTAQRYYAVLKRALQVAVRQEILPGNPADRVDRPRKNQFHGSVYTAQQVKTLLDESAQDEIFLPVFLSAYYGLRRSEVLGLRWSAVDFKQKTIEINHKLVTCREDGKTITVGEDELKNKSSHRVLPLIPQVEQVLLQAREQQELYRKKFGRSWCGKWEGYICLLPDGEIITPNFLTAHFGRLLKKHNLPPIRFHDLRHTCASLLVQAGVSMKQVQLWMGHSDFSTTADIYAHLAPGALVESAGVLGSLLGEEPAETASEN